MPTPLRHRAPPSLAWAAALLATLLLPSLASAQQPGPTPTAPAAPGPAAAVPPQVTVTVTPEAPTDRDVVTVAVEVRGRIVLTRALEPTLRGLELLYAQTPLKTLAEDGTPMRTFLFYALPEGPGVASMAPFDVFGPDGTSTRVPERLIRVAEADWQAPVLGEDARFAMDHPDGTLALRVAPSADRVYVGQPLTLEARVFAAADRPAVVDRVLMPFRVSGVDVDWLDEPSTDEQATHESTYAEDHVRLVPLSDGELVISPMIVLVSESGPDGTARPRVLTSAPFVLPVAAPPAGAPPEFMPENVGRFHVTTELVDGAGQPVHEAETGQSLTLRVVVKGDRDVGHVKIVVPRDHPHYAIAADPVQAGGDVRTKGAHTFTRVLTYSLTPLVPGETVTPAVKLAYFDPSDAWYRSVEVPGRPVRVRGEAIVADRTPMPIAQLLGGRTLGAEGAQALEFRAGWPGAVLSYVTAVGPGFDVAPRLGVLWGRNVEAGLVGLEPGVELTFNLLHAGPWSLAVLLEPTFIAQVPTDGSAGLFGARLGTALRAGYQLRPDLAMGFGLRVAPAVLGGPGGPLVTVPVLGEATLEWQLHRDAGSAVNLALQVGIGPDFCAAGPCRTTDVVVDGGVGVVVAF